MHALQLEARDPSAWARLPYSELLKLERGEREPLQLQALQLRFERLRDRLPALKILADKQGVQHIASLDDALAVAFDHRVYKSYPLSLIERRDFKRLTAWLQRLTTNDLSSMSLDGLDSVDSWLDRLDAHGMLIGHSTGTTGKLSFVPRSKVEWPAWVCTYFECFTASSGVDPRKVMLHSFFPGYRSGHHMMVKMVTLFAEQSLGGLENHHTLYHYGVSSDLMSLAGRLQAAEDKGELQRLQIDPKILEQRRELIERSRRRDADLEAWFLKMAEDYRGKRVRIGGTFADLTRIAIAGKAKGIRCSFAPGSILVGGGGMKGYKDAPADWEDRIKAFFGIDSMTSFYGMSEIMGCGPLCPQGFFHLPPYTVPVLVDADSRALPRTGVQQGRIALFDLLADTYWGGFISGDKVTMHWEEDCPCGWKGPRLNKTIERFSEMEGGDDKITCAGSAQAYSEFMDYVTSI
jgi:hypothetical protein